MRHASTAHWSLDLLHSIISHIGVSKFSFTDNIPPSQENIVYLISESPSYLFLHETYVETQPTLFLSDTTKRFKIPTFQN